ncbi:MAG: GNAT family N-acetyltransferase [Burkholderiales bacterium]|nr:GNAT family N-acetyltransferase [Burkholderiales bacterium]
MHILIREFEEPDRDTLRHLYLESRKAAFTWNTTRPCKPADFDSHTEGEHILVAVANAEIIGFASIWVPDSFLHNLFVHPSFMRKGVGRALLAACNKYFSRTPSLKCLKANVNAVQFYQSQGWKVAREEMGPDGPYLLMEKINTLRKTSALVQGCSN